MKRVIALDYERTAYPALQEWPSLVQVSGFAWVRLLDVEHRSDHERGYTVLESSTG